MPAPNNSQDNTFLVQTEAEREYLYYYFWPWVCNIGDRIPFTPPHLQHTPGPFESYAARMVFPFDVCMTFPVVPRAGVRTMPLISCIGFRGWVRWNPDNPMIMREEALRSKPKKEMHRATIIPLSLPE